jgi:predicted DNA-binding transcriptional regulator YafY
MCQAFARHLLGEAHYKEATQALLKSRALLPRGAGTLKQHFASFRSGTIDYTQHQETVRALIEAMDEKRVCKVTYQAIWDGRAKTFYVKPLKLFSHKDTVYLHSRMARYPGKRYKEPDFDPLLAVHRIKKVEKTERPYAFPKDYDFEKTFNKAFGVIKEDSFKVNVEFTGWAGRFVSERIWSPDQKLTRKKDGTVRLTFTTSSEPEFISWLLSFGEEAKLLRPAWLVKRVKEVVEEMVSAYGGGVGKT